MKLICSAIQTTCIEALLVILSISATMHVHLRPKIMVENHSLRVKVKWPLKIEIAEFSKHTNVFYVASHTKSPIQYRLRSL